MNIANIIVLILNIFLFFLNFYLFTSYKNYKIQDAKQWNEIIESLKKEQKELLKENQDLKKEIFYKKEELNKEFQDQKNKINQQLAEYSKNKQQLIDRGFQQKENLANEAIKNMNNQLETHKTLVQNEKNKLNKELENLKSSLNAGIEMRLREQEKKKKIDFYKLELNENDLNDVKKLEELKPSLNKPVILSKLIWTQYFQKQMTELCERVVGKTITCGIYKITNTLNNKCYIGQSVNIQERFKQHCKCGLGIDASATNKLYNAMQKDKIWNFTFEVVEKCSNELLNEKEKFWIQMYQSNNFGYNATKGNK